jgi:pyridoxine 5-phosphate synthase
MAATDEIIAIALDVLPDLVTIVPEKREELTTEGGLDVASNVHFYTDLVGAMHDKRIDVSYFIDPDPMQVEAAARCGADIIELHTGTYANARTKTEAASELVRLRTAAEIAAQAGLIVTAGHGLDARNIAPICLIPQIEEVSVGHALIARALFVGMEGAVKEMLTAIDVASR